MANAEQLAILDQGVRVWNKWRQENPNVEIDLSDTNLSIRDLTGVNFRKANLRAALLGSCLLNRSDLTQANLDETELNEAELDDACLNQASLYDADIKDATLRHAKVTHANLRKANLKLSSLVGTDLSGADLTGANLTVTNLWYARFDRANLSQTLLIKAYLAQAHLPGADLRSADLSDANLIEADLSNADLTGARLDRALLIDTVIGRAKISGSSVHAVNVWGLKGEFAEQKDLIITPKGAPVITVNNIEVAQFIHLILHKKEIRDWINALTSRSVLILGRFTIPERQAILDALKNDLRFYNLSPIVFNLDCPIDKDFIETIKALVDLSYFVIADITGPQSPSLELQTTVLDHQIPFVPIIQEGKQPFAMMADLQKKYNWVLETVSYNSLETLMKALKPAIIDPAIQKHNELRLIKAREPKIR